MTNEMEIHEKRQRGRGAGEGSIFQRKDGRWAAALTVSAPGQPQRRRTIYGSSYGDVNRRLAVLRTKRDAGLPVMAPARLRVGELLDQWGATVRPALRESTWRSYESLIRLHLQPGLGAVAVAKLTPATVSRFLLERLEAGGLSPRSVQLLHRVLSMALAAGVRWDLAGRNVAALVSPPRVPRPEVHAFTPEQARTFLAAVADDRLRALYVLALCSGARRGELLGLRWQDLDLEAGTLAVRHALIRVKGGWQLASPKTPGSRRVVRLPAVAVDALRNHRVVQLRDRLLAGDRWRQTEFVFTSTVGTALDGDNVYVRFQAQLARAGLPRIPFHALRHSAATLLLALGVPAKVVAEQLGHSRIAVTMDTYSHVLPHLQEEAAAKMDALLTRP